MSSGKRWSIKCNLPDNLVNSDEAKVASSEIRRAKCNLLEWSVFKLEKVWR